MNFYKLKWTKENIDIFYMTLEGSKVLFFVYEKKSKKMKDIGFRTAAAVPGSITKVDRLPLETIKPLIRAIFKERETLIFR